MVELPLEELLLLVQSDEPLARRRLALTALVRVDPDRGASLVEQLLAARGRPTPDDRAVAYHGFGELARTPRNDLWQRLVAVADVSPEMADAVAEALAAQGRQVVIPLLRSRLDPGQAAVSRVRGAVLLATRFADLSGLEILAADLAAEGSPLADAVAAFSAIPPAQRSARYAALVTARIDAGLAVERLRDLLLLLDAPTRLSAESIVEVARLLADSRQTDLPSEGLRRPLGDLAAYVLARCALAAPWYHQAELLVRASAETRSRLRESLRGDLEELLAGSIRGG